MFMPRLDKQNVSDEAMYAPTAPIRCVRRAPKLILFSKKRAKKLVD